MKTNVFLWCTLLIAGAVTAQPQAKISPNDWTVYSDNDQKAALKDTLYQGKESLHLDGTKMAVAVKRGAQYRNFRIECDIAGRVMSGIGFRARDRQNYHFLYFRPGYGGTQEAIQYIPIYNGSLSWVLYNYPLYEKTADMQSLQWFHIAMEVRENRLNVFVNHSTEAQLSVNLLESDFNDGDILLRSMFGESYFANISIRELPQVIQEWKISEQFPRGKSLELDPNSPSARWTAVHPDGNNVVNISKYIPNPNGVIIAKHSINAAADKDMLLYLAFVGKLKVFLNGKELYYYEKAKLDRIFSGTDCIRLPLHKGDNQLLLVSEGDAFIFGKGYNAMGRTQHQNWGFIAELGN